MPNFFDKLFYADKVFQTEHIFVFSGIQINRTQNG